MAATLMQPSLACAGAPSQTRLPAVGEHPSRCSHAPAHSSRPGSASIVGHRISWRSSRGRSVAGGVDVSCLWDAVWSVRHRAAGPPGLRPMTAMTTNKAATSKPVIQFIRGINEQSVPDVRLTRSRDGSNGVANFVFDQPSVFDSSRELGDITGIYMIDFEGVLSSVDVSAKFVNGKPAKIEARYVMRNIKEWDRFMRFMERYATENQLGFVKS